MARRLPAEGRGFSILEITASTVLFLAAMAAFFSVSHASRRGAEAARGLRSLAAAAENRMEEIQALPDAGVPALDGRAFDVPGLPGASGRVSIRESSPRLLEVRVRVEARLAGSPRDAPPRAVDLLTLRRRP